MEGRHSPKHAAPTRAERRRPERETRRVIDDRPVVEERQIREERLERRTHGKNRPVWKLIIQDIILTGVVLCVFATFHHVIPRLTAKSTPVPVPTSVLTTPAPQDTPDMQETDVPEETPEASPEVQDGRTEWQKKFEEHFTDEVIITENSYTSPNISITVSTVTTDEANPSTYYVADIYVAQIENFQTYFATGEYRYYASESPVSMAQNSAALISINGDYCDSQKSGFLVRNGQLYHNEQTTNDICVLYYDGTMETFEPSEYLVEDVVAKSPYQVWKFGPELLDENGQPKQSFNTSETIAWENPRSGIGYFEPGHYCFIIVDGRQAGYSRGLEMDRFAQIFADLGCKAAYNLDGGASAVMTFNQSIYNRPSNGGRDSGDILLIRELPEQTAEGGEG